MARFAASVVALLMLMQSREIAQLRCGSDRWPVKTMTDMDRNRVSLDPVATSIRALISIPIPEVPYPANRRLAPQELTTYTIRGRMIARFVEADQDVHIVLQDVNAEDATLIVEVPLAACAAASLLLEKFHAVRSTALAIPMHSVITVTGVGFFDFLHNARGQAPNGFELHPVFDVKIWLH